jgi:hypothetical protein
VPEIVTLTSTLLYHINSLQCHLKLDLDEPFKY